MPYFKAEYAASHAVSQVNVRKRTDPGPTRTGQDTLMEWVVATRRTPGSDNTRRSVPYCVLYVLYYIAY